MHIEFAYFYFTLFIGIEMITTFIHSRSSLENHTQFQTKMGKVYTRFQTKTAKKTLPDGEAHTHIAYIREHPPGAKSKILVKYICYFRRFWLATNISQISGLTQYLQYNKPINGL